MSNWIKLLSESYITEVAPLGFKGGTHQEAIDGLEEFGFKYTHKTSGRWGENKLLHFTDPNGEKVSMNISGLRAAVIHKRRERAKQTNTLDPLAFGYHRQFDPT